MLTVSIQLPDIDGIDLTNRNSEQIEKDVDRSLCNFNLVRDILQDERARLRRALTKVLNGVYFHLPALHYY